MMRRSHKTFVLLAGLLALVGTASPARAQSATSTAEALFQAGRALFDEGKTDEACKKLAEAQRLEPGGGTLLLLGICHEKQGKVASAEAELRSALVIARRDRRNDREKLAQRHLDAVAGRAPKVRFVVVSDAKDLRVRIDDGETLSREVLGVDVPVDPGRHVVRVEAGGHLPATVELVAPARPETVEVVLPRLELAPAPQPATPPVAPSEPGRGRRMAAFVTGGASLVALGVGAGFGVRAMSLAGDVRDACDPSSCGDPRAFATNDDAKVAANVANVAIGVGLAAGIAAIVLFVTAPDAPRPPPSAHLRGLHLDF